MILEQFYDIINIYDILVFMIVHYYLWYNIILDILVYKIY